MGSPICGICQLPLLSLSFRIAYQSSSVAFLFLVTSHLEDDQKLILTLSGGPETVLFDGGISHPFLSTGLLTDGYVFPFVPMADPTVRPA